MILAIDPGQSKCGWALVDQQGIVASRGIWPLARAAEALQEMAAGKRIELVVLGDGTGHRHFLRTILQDTPWRDRIQLVDEAHSSEEARRRCVLAETRGWRRLIPATLRHPSGPYDDYVAVILAERYLRDLRKAVNPE